MPEWQFEVTLMMVGELEVCVWVGLPHFTSLQFPLLFASPWSSPAEISNLTLGASRAWICPHEMTTLVSLFLFFSWPALLLCRSPTPCWTTAAGTTSSSASIPSWAPSTPRRCLTARPRAPTSWRSSQWTAGSRRGLAGTANPTLVRLAPALPAVCFYSHNKLF